LRDIGVFHNIAVVVISNFNEESMLVHYFPSKDKSPHRIHTAKEIVSIKFNFPKIFIIKGTNELLTYNISQDRYYYMKLNAPLLLEASTITTDTDIVNKGFLDFGNYLIPTQISISTAIGATSSWNIFKKKLYKSDFPDQKLIAIFDTMQLKFAKKDEDAFIFQFSESIYA
jgi:hypothetical protein